MKDATNKSEPCHDGRWNRTDSDWTARFPKATGSLPRFLRPCCDPTRLALRSPKTVGSFFSLFALCRRSAAAALPALPRGLHHAEEWPHPQDQGIDPDREGAGDANPPAGAGSPGRMEVVSVVGRRVVSWGAQEAIAEVFIEVES